MRHVRKPFTRDMVLALLNRSKTQTRRKGKLDAFPGDIIAVTEAWWSYGQWVETGYIDKTRWWMKNPSVAIIYEADHPEGFVPAPVENEPGKWRKMPGMHLPLKDTRLFLEVERSWRGPLQDMSPADAIAEGIERVDMTCMGDDPETIAWRYYFGETYAEDGVNYCESEIDSYKSLWDSINGKGEFAWRFNPEVSAYQFKILEGYKI